MKIKTVKMEPVKILPVTLEGNFVRLEPLQEVRHLPGLCAIGLDPDLWSLVPYQVTTPEEMREYIRHALEAETAGAALPFVKIEKSTGRVVGSARYMNIDMANRRVEIGATWIGAPWQRTAINTESKYLLLRHAFETLGCIRVELKTDALNERSRKAILRIGAKEEGTLRQHMLTWSGRRRDTVYFSILDSEWPGVKANLEEKLKQHA
jgi:RimJ/RimL family protein N-acetyltransferase